MAEELAALPKGAVILEWLADYAVLRDQARACHPLGQPITLLHGWRRCSPIGPRALAVMDRIEQPLPGRPAVARLPRGLIVYFAPRGPKDSDALDFDRFSVTQGARRTRRQKRKANYAPPDRRMNFA